MKLFGCWLGVLGWVALAGAGEPRVMDLQLHPAPSWVRAGAAQEEADDALGFAWPVPGGVGLQVLVPRNPPLLKSDAATFYRNLGRKWTHLYGKSARIGWLRFDGPDQAADGPDQDDGRWLVCRRPGNDGGVVFHLARAHGGRGYSILVFAPDDRAGLPPAVQAFMAGVAFQALEPAPAPALPALQASAAEAPRPDAVAAPPRTWRPARHIALVPQGEALSALAQAEGDALGDSGMLTGYRVQSRGEEGAGAPPGLSWELEGFRWANRYGRDLQEPFALRGQLSVTPPATWPGELGVDFQVAEAPATVAVVVTQGAYCGSQAAWQEAVAFLERGSRARLHRLGQARTCGDTDPAGRSPGGGGPRSRSPSTPLAHWEAQGGERLSRTLGLEAPQPREPQGQDTYRWLEVSLQASPGSVGAGLLDRLALILIYRPE